jgi:DNA-directed RNA polymerase specialized sigma24 family protein
MDCMNYPIDSVSTSSCATDEELMAQVETTPAAFWELFERHCQSVFRYYAVRANGNLERARELTVSVFWTALQKYKTFHKERFVPWFFGVAWDVFNAHRLQADVKRLHFHSPVTFNAQKVSVSSVGNHQALRALRSIPFYARETLYLRYFAEVKAHDIAFLMDLSETEVRTAVYQGLLHFSQIDSGTPAALPMEEELASFAELYDVFLTDWLAGVTPQVNMPAEAIRATNRLRSLREAITLRPEMQAVLRGQLERMICSAPASGERL